MRLTAIALLGALLAAAPAAADDLIYQVRSSDPDILTTFGGEAYWKPLARCAGIYTSIGVHLRNDGKGDLADAVEQERGLFMSAYGHRIMTDRGVSAADAMAVAHDELINSSAMMDDAMADDPSAQGEMLTQCEKAYNIILQDTAGQ